MNVDLIKILLSVIFVSIGTSVFFLASLISGKNIYKDNNSNFSNISSALIGAVPFVLLPIGFMIITPNLFIKDFDNLDLHEQVLLMHKLIFENALTPFLLACIGFGIVVGSVQSLNYRVEFLRGFRKVTKININIISYDNCWDDFLMRIKRYAYIEVGLENGAKLTGEKEDFSIRDEKIALTLKNARLDDSDKPSAIILTEACKIKYISVRDNAFKKHEDIMSHSAQASYRVLLAIGFSLVVLSIGITFNYFEMKPGEIKILTQTNHANWFVYLARFYEYVWWPLWAVTAFFAVSGIYFLRKDFRCYCSAFVLFPQLSSLLLFLISYVFLLLSLFLDSHYAAASWLRDEILQVVWIMLLIAAAAISFYILLKRNSINTRVKRIIDINASNENAWKRYLKPLVHWLWREMNLNTDDDTVEYKKLKKQLEDMDGDGIKRLFYRVFEKNEIDCYKEARNAFFEEVESLISNETGFFGKKYLEGEELNIIEIFNSYLEK